MSGISLHSGYFTRQLDLVSLDRLRAIHFTIIGLGATGSWVALKLAKMGATKIDGWDFDTVEDVNVSPQVYGPAHIGKPKVEAAAEILAQLAGVQMTPHNERFSGFHQLSGIVICCVDTMKDRKEIWENCIKLKPQVELFLETRMAPFAGRVFAIKPCDPDHIAYFERTLIATDTEAIQSPCTATAIVYNVSTVSDWVTRGLRNYIQGVPVETEVTYTTEGKIYHLVVDKPPII